MNDSVGYLSRVVYKCDEGFRLVHRAELICDVDARWNGPPPRCESKYLNIRIKSLMYSTIRSPEFLLKPCKNTMETKLHFSW